MKTSLELLVTFTMFANVYQAVGQMNFAAATNYPVSGSPYCVIATDLNGNGTLDLVTADDNRTLTVLTNNGDGVFGSNAVYYAPFAQWVVPIDVNGSGKVDLVCACGTGSLMVLTNSGSGTFATASNYTVGNDPYVITADVNGDGNLDLISVTSSALIVLTNAGDGTFQVSSSPGVAARSFTAADANGDGKTDLIEATPNCLWVLTNAGNATFSLASTNTLATWSPGLITAADVNGDGKAEVIVPDYDSGSGSNLILFAYKGSGLFTSNSSYTVGKGPYSVIATDVNGDGKLDLITENMLSGTLTVLTNDGSGGFGRVDYPVGSVPNWVIAADVNGDGKVDLISALHTSPGAVSVLMNTSVFPPPGSTPGLNINLFRNGAHVSWPSASAGWSLQQNRNLSATQWGPSGYNGYGISSDGTNMNLTISTTPGTLFFRLLHP